MSQFSFMLKDANTADWHLSVLASAAGPSLKKQKQSLNKKTSQKTWYNEERVLVQICIIVASSQ